MTKTEEEDFFGLSKKDMSRIHYYLKEAFLKLNTPDQKAIAEEVEKQITSEEEQKYLYHLLGRISTYEFLIDHLIDNKEVFLSYMFFLSYISESAKRWENEISGKI